MNRIRAGRGRGCRRKNRGSEARGRILGYNVCQLACFIRLFISKMAPLKDSADRCDTAVMRHTLHNKHPKRHPSDNNSLRHRLIVHQLRTHCETQHAQAYHFYLVRWLHYCDQSDRGKETKGSDAQIRRVARSARCSTSLARRRYTRHGLLDQYCTLSRHASLDAHRGHALSWIDKTCHYGSRVRGRTGQRMDFSCLRL